MNQNKKVALIEKFRKPIVRPSQIIPVSDMMNRKLEIEVL